MQSFFIVSALLILNCSVHAQATGDSPHAPSKLHVDSNTIYNDIATDSAGTKHLERHEALNYVQVMPKFPGGDSQLLQFISNNIRYPREARRNGIQGRLIVRFIVDENGQVTNANVPKGLGIGAGCDEEAVRVISSLPRWEPGTQNGRAVPVWYTVPIIFKLAGRASPSDKR